MAEALRAARAVARAVVVMAVATAAETEAEVMVVGKDTVVEATVALEAWAEVMGWVKAAEAMEVAKAGAVKAEAAAEEVAMEEAQSTPASARCQTPSPPTFPGSCHLAWACDS